MIDNKKIEEAAINKCGFISSEFYSGAKWAIDEFLKDLWHPVWKKPEDNRYILWEEKYSGVKSTIFYNATKYNTCYDEPWNNKVASLNITRWLYIDDLLLKK